MFYSILDKKRLDVLPLLKVFKNRFYLAGGTGLAIQLGHRDSIDFDFFSVEHIDTVSLYRELFKLLSDKKISKNAEEKDSLTITIDDDIKLSFFWYQYKLLNPLLDEENLNIASIEDIACMKCAAIVSRATEKDYIDLYFILKKILLSNILLKMREKMPDLDENIVLKSLIYFNDVPTEKILFKNGMDTPFKKVQEYLITLVKDYYKRKDSSQQSKNKPIF